MVKVSRLNGKSFYINPDLIEFVEETPDTVLTMTTGKKLVVEETAEDVLQKIIDYKQKVFLGLPQKLQRGDLDCFEG